METNKIKKQELRKNIKQQLKQLDQEEKKELDHAVCEKLFQVPEISEAKNVYAYMSLSWETGTEEILKRFLEQNIRVALPRVSGERMDFYEITSFDDMEEGAFHILEPKSECQKVEWKNACVLVPGLAFTKEGIRLGKGGGYYDRFFEEEPNHETFALAYEFQIVDAIPSEPHDRPVGQIITEKRII